MGVKDSFLARLLSNADKFSDDQITQTIDLLVANGIKHGATDIHIEPHPQFVWIRYRIGGHLQGLHKLPLGALAPVSAKFKELSNLDVTSLTPQEGSYETTVDGAPVRIRLSAMPVVGGEKIVLHLSVHSAAPSDLAELGFWGEGLLAIQNSLARSYGLILVGSPKHAGRAATLYSLIALVHRSTVSVATVEDPIEHHLSGITQTSANGLGIAAALKAALSQDPNVIMTSDIPDHQTALQAVQASTSGHMVLAGMHADSAAQTIAQLKHLGVESFLLATSLKLAIAQRITRRLCEHCREQYTPTTDQVTYLNKALSITTAAARQHLHGLEKRALEEGIGSGVPLGTSTTRITHLWRASQDGCEHCHHTGYKGHLLLTEVIAPGARLQEALLKASATSQLHTAALKDGFIPLGLDGLVKALRGQTTIVEVLKATTGL